MVLVPCLTNSIASSKRGQSSKFQSADNLAAEERRYAKLNKCDKSINLKIENLKGIYETFFKN